MRMINLDKRLYLLLILIALVACVPPSSSEVETERPEDTAVELMITPEPVTTEVINVDVVWNEGEPVRKDDPRTCDAYWHLFGLNTTLEDDMVTISAGYACGDECGGNQTLVVQDNGSQNLPTFISFDQSESDIFDETEHSFSLQNGILAIDEWDTDGIISGYVEAQEGKPSFYFWHNFDASSNMKSCDDEQENISLFTGNNQEPEQDIARIQATVAALSAQQTELFGNVGWFYTASRPILSQTSSSTEGVSENLFWSHVTLIEGWFRIDETGHPQEAFSLIRDNTGEVSQWVVLRNGKWQNNSREKDGLPPFVDDHTVDQIALALDELEQILAFATHTDTTTTQAFVADETYVVLVEAVHEEPLETPLAEMPIIGNRAQYVLDMETGVVLTAEFSFQSAETGEWMEPYGWVYEWERLYETLPADVAEIYESVGGGLE